MNIHSVVVLGIDRYKIVILNPDYNFVPINLQMYRYPCTDTLYRRIIALPGFFTTFPIVLVVANLLANCLVVVALYCFLYCGTIESDRVYWLPYKYRYRYRYNCTEVRLSTYQLRYGAPVLIFWSLYRYNYVLPFESGTGILKP